MDQSMTVTSVLRVKVGPWGGTEGDPWVEGGGGHGGGGYTGIRSIEIRGGWLVDSILVEYDDNGKPAVGSLHGKGGGQPNKIELNFPDEFLTGVGGCKDAAFIRSLSFSTNQRRMIGPFGNRSYNMFRPDSQVEFNCSVDGAAIVGFCGRSDIYLNAIGLYVAVWNPEKFYDAMRKQGHLAYRTSPLRLQSGPGNMVDEHHRRQQQEEE